MGWQIVCKGSPTARGVHLAAQGCWTFVEKGIAARSTAHGWEGIAPRSLGEVGQPEAGWGAFERRGQAAPPRRPLSKGRTGRAARPSWRRPPGPGGARGGVGRERGPGSGAPSEVFRRTLGRGRRLETLGMLELFGRSSWLDRDSTRRFRRVWVGCMGCYSPLLSWWWWWSSSSSLDPLSFSSPSHMMEAGHII